MFKMIECLCKLEVKLFRKVNTGQSQKPKQQNSKEAQVIPNRRLGLIFKLFYLEKNTVIVSFKLSQILYIKELILMVTKKIRYFLSR